MINALSVELPSGQPRGCDLAAGQVLDARQRSRVFPAPSRAAIAGADYAKCCVLNEAVMGVRLSKQAHAIMPKIAEVDRLMTPALQVRVREVHPKVSFCILNGSPLTHGKKTIKGPEERLEIMRRQGVVFDPFVERRFGASQLTIDDLVDSAVAMVTASRIAAGIVRVLGDGRVDPRGLRMEICA
jgi:predicted RNase H-like nuclease